MKNKGLFIGVIISAFLIITGVVMYFSYSNKYVTLVNQYEAQVAEDKVIYDEVWKVIKQQAQVTDQYSEKFKEIYLGVMDARYSKGDGSLMKWITEQNPNFTPEMYTKLMQTIESQRAKFTNVQRKLIAIHMEIKNLVMLFPSSMFVGSRPIPELQIVTSTKTENTFNTGKEDDVEVFTK